MIAAEAVTAIEFYSHVRTIIASCNIIFRTSHKNFNKRRDASPQIPEFKSIFSFPEGTLLVMTLFPHFVF